MRSRSATATTARCSGRRIRTVTTCGPAGPATTAPAGGPVIDNAEAGYGWSTYPERLERAGISWKIYQDIGLGLDAAGKWGQTEDAYIGNYGDNSLLYFHQYQNAPPGSALYEKARRGTNIAAPGTPFDELFTILRDDVRHDRLPQVSWIVAPEAFTEHGNWPSNYGAWYMSQVLDALTSNPQVWSKTVLFVTYDENDGFFDHLVPPTPAGSAAEGASTVDTRDEIFAGSADNPRGPYGLGVRVPMIVVSPWSKGGWVCSQVFDHTSLIRFLERRFGPHHPGADRKQHHRVAPRGVRRSHVRLQFRRPARRCGCVAGYLALPASQPREAT